VADLLLAKMVAGAMEEVELVMAPTMDRLEEEDIYKIFHVLKYYSPVAVKVFL